MRALISDFLWTLVALEYPDKPVFDTCIWPGSFAQCNIHEMAGKKEK